MSDAVDKPPRTVTVGDRVRVDMNRVRCSLPKARGQLSPEGIRLTRVLEEIVDRSGQRPVVTEVRGAEVEIASCFFGEGMKTLRVPLVAITLVGHTGLVPCVST
jgi:hypothetical protein